MASKKLSHDHGNCFPESVSQALSSDLRKMVLEKRDKGSVDLDDLLSRLCGCLSIRAGT